MLKTIEQEISELPSNSQKKFAKTMTEVLSDNFWLRSRGLENSTPWMVAFVLYNEIFEGDFSYLHMRDTYKN